MARLIPLSELVRDRNYDLSGAYNPVGESAYAMDGERVGKVEEALTDDGGQIRYLVVDAGGWFSSRRVVVPVGMARIEDDGVYFDTLSKDQVKGMSEYVPGQDYQYEHQVADERVLRGSAAGASATAAVASTGGEQRYDYAQAGDMYRTPQKLQLIEERLQVGKERFVAGQVTIGKHVETRTENVNVELEREELVIERRPVSEMRPVEGNVTLGEGSETIRVDLEAERAQVAKQAFVTEEVEIGKRTVHDTQTVSETVGREVLDVNQQGQVVTGEGTSVQGMTGTQASTQQGGRGALDRAADAVKDAVDPLDGKIDRR